MKWVGEVMGMGGRLEEGMEKGVGMIGEGMEGLVEKKEVVMEEMEKGVGEGREKGMLVM